MAEQESPPWGDDRFSKFFREAEFKTRAAAVKYPDVFALLQRVCDAFEKTHSSREVADRMLPRILLVRTYSAYCAACRLAMSGQSFEAHVVLRAGLEAAWYGLHIAKDPVPLTRANIWLQRHDGDQALGRCKTEFRVKNVRATHKALDVVTEADMGALYDRLIDYGAHPNPRGVLATVRKVKTENRPGRYDMSILDPEPEAILFALLMAAKMGVGVLKMFRLVYPERFSIVGLYGEIENLVTQIRDVFDHYYAGAAGEQSVPHVATP